MSEPRITFAHFLRHDVPKYRLILQRMYLPTQTEFPMSEVSEYKQEAITSDSSNSFLDPHHTHFILVDNDETGSEIDFRSKFESRQLYSGKRQHRLTGIQIVCSHYDAK